MEKFWPRNLDSTQVAFGESTVSLIFVILELLLINKTPFGFLYLIAVNVAILSFLICSITFNDF